MDAALALLAGEDSRCLAGGQSLMPMMNFDLVSPVRLVSLRAIPVLRVIEHTPEGGLRIGAMITHAEIAARQDKAAGARLLAAAARLLGYPAIRNQGTLGGSVAHADPAADYPGVLLAADAAIEIAGKAGARCVAAAEFFHGMFETALAPAEIVTAVHLPPGPAGAGVHYEKFTLVAGDYAIASVAAIIAFDGARCSAAALAVGSCAPGPVRSAVAEQALLGSALDDAAIGIAAAALVKACAPADDNRASGAYRTRVLPGLVRRAVHRARDAAIGRRR
jgi:carbon-monoxide dehydrogenase medium subunit